MRYTNAFILLFFLCLNLDSIAQTDQFQFNHIDISQGLSHNQVNSILKDSKGFLWFATMSGLNRYDGYRFKIFTHNLRDSTSLIDDYISRIFEGPEGKIWVETRSGVNVFDPATESADRNISVYLKKLSLPDTALTNMMKDNQGNYWFLMAQQSLFKYSSVTGKTTHIYKLQPGAAAIVSFAQDSHADIWIVHANGAIEKIDNKTGKVIARIDALAVVFKNELFNYSLFVDAQQELWLFVSGDARGVLHYIPSSGVLQQINKDSRHCRLNNNIVVGLLQDNKGRIWIGTDHGGINVLDKSTNSVSYILNNIYDRKSLSQNSITATYKDNAGIIWIGTYKQGINYYHENIIKFPSFRHQPADPGSLQYDDVNRFAEDAKGNLWIGSNGGGLIYYDRAGGKFIQYVHHPDKANSLNNDVIVSLYIDHQQKLWIGTYFGGLDCYDGKQFVHYRHNPSDSNSLADDRVYEILEDSNKNLWIGTLSGGLDRLDREKNIFYHYKAFAPNSIHSNYISELMEDREGNLWVGTANGIDVLEKKTGRFIYYSNFTNNPKGISNNNIISLLQDSRGLIWIGTRDGLNVFDKGNNSFKSFRTENGLTSNTILTIVEDDQQQLWVSTPNGISSIRVNQNNSSVNDFTITCKNYDELDGLQGTAFNENAALKTRRGELIFGGANGFNIFNPGTITPNKNIPAVVLTDLQIFNKSIGIGEKIDGRILLPQAISQTNAVTLKYNEDVLSFEFAALDFSNTEKNKYAYKLQGFNKEWLFTDGKMRKATYTNLDPGDYTFYVKAANGDGVWNEKGIALLVKILPPFWKTPVAYLLYVILLTGILWFARQLILQRAGMRFEIEHQKQEGQRMHELDMMKIRFFTNVSHEFRTPLSLILTPLDKIIRQTEEPGQRKQFQLIHRNARRLLNLVNQLLDFRKMEVQELQLNPVQGDIVKFTRDISHSFTDIAEKKNIQFSFYSPVESLLMPFDQDKLERILFNLLSNAFKFTGERGKVAVQLQMQMDDNKQLLAIKVIDTGIGIPKEKQEKIFERFFQNDIPGSMVNQGSGIGLAITKEFVKLHKGSIEVTSEPEKGSCFTILLPVTEMPVIKDGQETIAEEKDFEKEIKLQEHEEAGIHGKKATLLLVEDNEDFRFYLKDNLREQFAIIEAANGKEGWQKALGYHPDLVVADISMPEMNGIDLCKKIKKDQRTSHMPVILLTALAGEEQQLKGLETGANDYMTKPFNFEILLSRVKNILEEQARLRKTFQKKLDVKPADISIASPDEQFIYQALEIVEKNISNADFSVEDMSRSLFMSRVTLYKKLLALTGKTPIEFIRSIRLKRAAQLLEKAQMTVSEVAYEVGFNSPKSFSKYFKTEFNTSPSSYIGGKKTDT
jgi:signal transduction histidine kinase/ligand-binding sensor domain-containing protein/DNA-binding response OmpR family regulator